MATVEEDFPRGGTAKKPAESKIVVQRTEVDNLFQVEFHSFPSFCIHSAVNIWLSHNITQCILAIHISAVILSRQLFSIHLHIPFLSHTHSVVWLLFCALDLTLEGVSKMSSVVNNSLLVSRSQTNKPTLRKERGLSKMTARSSRSKRRAKIKEMV